MSLLSFSDLLAVPDVFFRLICTDFCPLHFDPLRLRMSYIFRCICCIFPLTIAVSI